MNQIICILPFQCFDSIDQHIQIICSTGLGHGRMSKVHLRNLGRSTSFGSRSICMATKSDRDFTENSTDQSRRMALRALVSSVAMVATTGTAFASGVDWGTLDDDEWKKRLAPDSYKILRKAGTEMPFSSPLNKEYRPGVFCCAGCGSQLFDSSAKFNSGTGWPSFTQALPGAVDETGDYSIVFMPRTEVTCHTCHGHLGHVFPDGPEPTGLRYCMNGLALTFDPSSSA